MKKIYVAGPYSGDNIMSILENIRSGQVMAHKLMCRGYAVFCPFLDYQLAFFNSAKHKITKEQFQNNSMAWLEVSDVLLVLKGWEASSGTLREIKRARQLNIPVFFDFDVFLEWCER